MSTVAAGYRVAGVEHVGVLNWNVPTFSTFLLGSDEDALTRPVWYSQ